MSPVQLESRKCWYGSDPLDENNLSLAIKSRPSSCDQALY